MAGLYTLYFCRSCKPYFQDFKVFLHLLRRNKCNSHAWNPCLTEIKQFSCICNLLSRLGGCEEKPLFSLFHQVHHMHIFHG